MYHEVEIGVQPDELAFRKSTHSGGADGCVEVADLPDGGRRVRDSKNPIGPALTFTAAEWAAFEAGVKDGQFN